MSIYERLRPIRELIPQKLRFAVGIVTVFPILVVVLLFGVNRRLVLALWDLGVDAYRGKFNGSPDEYIVRRMTE